jgi:molecular chaperone HscB
MTQCPHCDAKNKINIGICNKCNKVIEFKKNTSLFEIFNLAISPIIDKEILDNKYIEIITIFHPDRFIKKSSLEQEIASHNATLVNSAYQTLSSPLLTCEYIIKQFEKNQLGVIPDNVEISYDENNEDTYIDNTGWIIESMALHEELGSIKNLDQCRAFETKISKMLQIFIQLIQEAIISKKFVVARSNFEKCKFLERIIGNTQAKISNIEQNKMISMQK